MRKMYKIPVLSFLTVLFLFISCTDDTITGSPGEETEGKPLNLFVGFETTTRVGELPGPDAINDLENGLNHIGLYVYYTADYNKGDLSKPYIRNLECEVEDGRLVPILQSGETAADKNIYIYDYMTIVAFYPYNPDMSLEANWFDVRADEENYPITRGTYSEQTYIPYRGTATANPTTAYYINVTLYPKHTFKLEIILVSENTADFNDGSPDIKLLPAIDPVDNIDPTEGTREDWYDDLIIQPDNGGGMHVRQYIAYLWQDSQMNHVINQNDVLYENGDFTLLATEEVNPREQRVYRYGYNFTTGESFIPTSSNLINDAKTLQNFGGGNRTGYQVCDIDLNGVSFNPISMVNSIYDGGGHSISNLNVSSSGNEAGLFSRVLGNSSIRNVNLIDPVISVNTAADTCYVGALCGRVNDVLTAAELESLYASINLPDNMSQVVKDALLQELLQGVFNSQAQIIACRIENPQITVIGTHPRVGTVCGSNGVVQGDDGFRGAIWDTYSLGGTITVNNGNPGVNTDALVGGFCGLNEYYITRCYTTITEGNISAIRNVTVPDPDNEGQTMVEQQNIFQGFAWQGTAFNTIGGAGIAGSYAVAPDTNEGVSTLPNAWPPGSWVTYAGVWPINTSSWTNYNSNSFWYSIGVPGSEYPTLQWERR